MKASEVCSRNSPAFREDRAAPLARHDGIAGPVERAARGRRPRFPGTVREKSMNAIIMVTLTAASAVPGEGAWVVEDHSAVITIAACGDSLCGRITRILENSPGAPSTDVKNPARSLRNRPILGMTVLSGFKRSGTGWSNGRIYDPKSGNTYKSKLALGPDGILKVSGCVAFICRSQRWTPSP
jgi:uncharacterized protein (DUF2147 family)